MSEVTPLKLHGKPETAQQRIQHLQAEAKALAIAEIERLITSTRGLAAEADAIAKGGDAYPAGVRQVAERMADDLHGRGDNLTSLAGRIR